MFSDFDQPFLSVDGEYIHSRHVLYISASSAQVQIMKFNINFQTVSKKDRNLLKENGLDKLT
jgi:hypothetical protein